MPNLAGVFDVTLNEAQVRQENDRQIESLTSRENSFETYRFAHPGCGAVLLDHGILENGVQPASSDDGRYALLLDGEILNGDELRKRHRLVVKETDTSDPKLCLRLLSAIGPSVVQDFNGLFVLAFYDVVERRLFLIGDKFGFRPLFYTQRDGRLIFGSELKALAAVDRRRPQADELGLIELFGYGYQVMDRTWVKGYGKLPPGTYLEVAASGVTEHPYWRYAYDESAPRLDQESYFTGYRVLVDRAVERTMKGNKRIGIFLSGGYDSRAVAASIRRHHLPIPSITFGEAESRDVRFAAQLAERLGFEHTSLNKKGPYLRDVAQRVVNRTEGMIPFVGTTSIRYHPEIKQRLDIILTGILGELDGSHTWPGLLMARSRAKAIDAIFAKMVLSRAASVRRVFNSAFFARAFDGLKDAFLAGCERIPNEHPLNIADCWIIACSTPGTAFFAPTTDRCLFEVRAPLVDAELIDFLLRIPPMQRIEQRVYKKMIAYGYPAIRDVPCTNSARPIDPMFAREYGKMVVRLLARKATAPVLRALGIGAGLGREFSDVAAQVRSEPALVDELLRPMMSAGVYPSDVFDTDGINALVDEHYNRGADHALLIALVISWGIASQSLAGDSQSASLAA